MSGLRTVRERIRGDLVRFCREDLLDDKIRIVEKYVNSGIYRGMIYFHE